MSFLKPTAASKSRERAVREQRAGPSVTPTNTPASVPNFAQPLAQQLFRDTAGTHQTSPATTPATLPDYSHVRSRVDSGLYETRAQHALLVANRKRSRSPTTDLAQYTTRCNDVVQRAHQLLERTRRQEELVAKALEQRLSQSPAHRAPSSSSATSPTALRAPQVTPVSGPQGAGGHTATHPTADEVHSEREEAMETTTPSRRTYSCAPLPCPTPTPATVGVYSPAPHVPFVGSDEQVESPSFFQRVRRSLQRLSGSLPPDASPQPAATHTQSQSQNPWQASPGHRDTHSHARKSVHFVSPDKLEHVTPTKLQPLSSDEDSSEADAVAMEAVMAHARSVSAPPLPAPPPSAVKAAKSSSRGRSTSPSSSSRATKVPSSPPGGHHTSPSPVPAHRSVQPSPARQATSSPRRSDAVARTTLSSPRATSPRSPSPTSSPSKATEKAEKPQRAQRKTQQKAAKKAASKAVKSTKNSPKANATPVKVTFKVADEGEKTQKQTEGSKKHASASSSRSSSVASTPEQAAKLTKANRAVHEEMLEFIASNSIKRCVNNFTKDQLVTFLKGEGVPEVHELDMTKRQLLDEIRALLGKNK